MFRTHCWEMSGVLTSGVAKRLYPERVKGALTKDLFKKPSFPKQMGRSKGEKKDDHCHMKDNKIISRLYVLLCNLIKPQLLLSVCLVKGGHNNSCLGILKRE